MRRLRGALSAVAQGALVHRALVSGPGALSADPAVSDASGTAAVRWTLDTTARWRRERSG
ncbi:MAG: hypothetical protein P8Z36_09870 [Gemmatimonadota bacterium]